MATLQAHLEALAAAVGVDIKILRTVVTTTSTSTLTPTSTAHMYQVTALAATCTVANPTGSPVNGQSMLFRFKDNGSVQGLNWDTQFRGIGFALPSGTVANKTLYIGCIYNSADTKWDVLAIGREA